MMLRTGFILAAVAAGLAVLSLPGEVEVGYEMVPVRLQGKSLAMAVNEVTVAQWRQCESEGACDALASAAADAMPVTGVNWFDTQTFIAWANRRQGRHYRLPTIEEWRLVSGHSGKPLRKPLFDDPRLAWAANYGQEETPRGPVQAAGTWSTSRQGIHDLEGNVWEWTESCANAKQDPSRCAAMSVMGAHEAVVSVFVRDPASGGCATGTPPTHLGFRLVEDLP